MREKCRDCKDLEDFQDIYDGISCDVIGVLNAHFLAKISDKKADICLKNCLVRAENLIVCGQDENLQKTWLINVINGCFGHKDLYPSFALCLYGGVDSYVLIDKITSREYPIMQVQNHCPVCV